VTRRFAEEAGAVAPETIRRCQAGDPAALGEIYAACGRRIYALCRRMTGNDHEAEDLTQRIFLRAFERIRSFRGRAAFTTWLHRLAVNTVLNHREAEGRRRGAPLEEEPPATGTAPERRAMIRDEVEEVDRLLGVLPPDHRLVILLREYWELSYREMAEVLGVPVGTVMSRLARARERLKAELPLRSAPEGME